MLILIMPISFETLETQNFSYAHKHIITILLKKIYLYKFVTDIYCIYCSDLRIF